jgi:tetratricopeptide (TPR) repeat protein/mono/diheme cytochrome c family protein
MTGGNAFLGWLALLLSTAAPAAGQPPTFEKDIEPILSRRCVPCHQPDADAPFSLVTYADTRRHAHQIADVTAKRYMPLWKPDLSSPRFVGDRRLSDEDIALIGRWVEAGAPEGRSASHRETAASSRGWLLGEPDLILTLPTYRLRADGLDVFRNFVVTVPGQGTRYVRSLQLRPRSRAVHHANIRLDATPGSRALDAADPEPGYEGMILHSADYPDGHFLGWTPGQAPPPAGDLAWRLNGGTDLVVQLHLRPTGRVEEIAPLIGLYFTSEPPERIPAIVRLGRQNVDIAPGIADYRARDSFVVPVDAQVVAIQPHAHYRARQVDAWATLPNGVRRPLIHIGDWDFNWQDQYRLAEPFWVPAGTTLAMEYTFDNSPGNARNPTNPPERVSWGWRSSDEMGDVWIQVFTRNEADRQTFNSVARRKMAQEDAIGSEVLIAREPNYVNLRNDAALIYQELGQPVRALEHFAAVSRLEPRSPAAHFNEGVTLEALGRREEAKAQYEESIRLDPSYARAHNNLANILYIGRRLHEAAIEYRAVLQFDPTNIDARCNLARILTETNRPSEAVAQYRAALAQPPQSVACIVNFAWLLSAHRDPVIRRPAEAVALARQAVSLVTHPTAEILDVLSAAYASAGRFEAAIETETAALRLIDGTKHGALIDEMRERLGFYQRHLPFLVPN